MVGGEFEDHHMREEPARQQFGVYHCAEKIRRVENALHEVVRLARLHGVDSRARAGNVASVFGFDDGESRFVRTEGGEDLVNLFRFAKEQRGADAFVPRREQSFDHFFIVRTCDRNTKV
ncbi:hypothetical protein SDC9_102876 [bioreactor metagenome]|uniref:Uncharacterized protein n=1 Tax=bioreactor metagenome TaxID=1076179 RepID=A0A645ASM1_9ZZZZ